MEVDMKRVFTVIFGAVLVTAPIAVAGTAETVELVSAWNPSGQPPDGCSPGLTGDGRSTKWVIVDTRPEGVRGVAEVSADPTDYRFPVCIVDGPAYADLTNVDVSVRFRPVAGRVDQAGGLAVRLKDDLNYYVVRANALENNIRLYSVINGSRRQFAGVDARVTSNQWHTLRLRVVGHRFSVYFDGVALFEATDGRITGPGRVALWSKADSVTEFVDLAIERLP
jgi:hypothetical protein